MFRSCPVSGFLLKIIAPCVAIHSVCSQDEGNSETSFSPSWFTSRILQLKTMTSVKACVLSRNSKKCSVSRLRSISQGVQK